VWSKIAAHPQETNRPDNSFKCRNGPGEAEKKAGPTGCRSAVAAASPASTRLRFPKSELYSNTTEHGWGEIEKELDVVSAEQAKAKLFCTGLKVFFDHINVLRVVRLNRRSCSVSAVVSMERAKYLSSKFQEKLNKGKVKLDGVKSWLKAQMEKLHEQDRSMILNDFEKMTEMLHNSIVDLVCNRTTLEIPVTLYLDPYCIQFAL